uniref:AB hydrolase-1 domain-containing protein n=1 Tax=Dendroctonus ponderosae TaxID=77166 RepID=A0AAR5P0H5_DENPD
MGSAENFVIGGPQNALAYVLADKGYDVWVCNARGSRHSRKHRTLDPDRDMKKFWRFSFHEIGYYDLPATIDYILNITGKEKLHFIGHSQGTTTFFVMVAEKPEYNNKINVMVGLAPSVLLSHIREPTIRVIAPAYKYLQSLAESLGIYEILPKYLLSNEIMQHISTTLCEEQSITRVLCSNALVAMSGYTPDQLEPSATAMIASTGPAGASIYQASHFAQLVVTGKFARYDWGAKENKERYNSSIASEYNFNNMACPIALFYGEADIMATIEDVVLLANRLPNLVDFYKISLDSWSHMDFLWAKDRSRYMNKHLLRVLNTFID